MPKHDKLTLYPPPNAKIIDEAGELGYHVGSQLCTKDGRVCTNAHIINILKVNIVGRPSFIEGKLLFVVLSDARHERLMDLEDIRAAFHPSTIGQDITAILEHFAPEE